MSPFVFFRWFMEFVKILNALAHMTPRLSQVVSPCLFLNDTMTIGELVLPVRTFLSFICKLRSSTEAELSKGSLIACSATTSTTTWSSPYDRLLVVHCTHTSSASTALETTALWISLTFSVFLFFIEANCRCLAHRLRGYIAMLIRHLIAFAL